MTVDEAHIKADMSRAIQAWFDCPIERRPSAFALGKRIEEIAAAVSINGGLKYGWNGPRGRRWNGNSQSWEPVESHPADGFMLQSCREARRCLHDIPGCICDGEPGNG